MNMYLPPELEKFVNDNVQNGRYLSPSEMVVEGLRLLRDEEDLRRIRLEELRQEVQVGIDQLDRGEYAEYNSDNLDELRDKIIAEGRKRLAAEKDRLAS